MSRDLISRALAAIASGSITSLVPQSAIATGVNISKWPGVITGPNQSDAQRTANGVAIQAAITYCFNNKLTGYFDPVTHEIKTSTNRGLFVQGGTFRTTLDAYFIQFGTNEPVITMGDDSNNGSYCSNMYWEGGTFGYGVDQTGNTNANAIVLGKHFNSKFVRFNHSAYAALGAGSGSGRYLPYRALWIKGNNNTGGLNFFFSSEVSEVRLDHAQQAIMEVTCGGTDNKFKRIYMGGGAAGSQQVYAGAPLVINVNGTNAATDPGIWEECNIEWVSSHSMITLIGSQGMTCLNWHIEGVVLTGFNPTLVNVTGSCIKFIGGQWLDIYVKSANTTGGTFRMFYGYSGATCSMENVQLHWSTTVGPPDTTWQMWQPDSATLNGRQNFVIRNMNLAADSGTIVGFGLDAILTAATYGNMVYIGEYVYHPTLPKLRDVQTVIKDESYVSYGIIEKQFIYCNTALTANRTITLNPYLTNSGVGSRMMRRVGDIVRVVRNTGSTGSFSINVNDHLGNTLASLSAANMTYDFVFDGKRFQLGTAAVANVLAEAQSSATTETLSDINNGTTRSYSNACSITVPNNMVAGFNCDLVQNGTGAITLVAASGTTLTSVNGNLQSAYQGGRLRLECITNTTGTAASYIVTGDIVSETAPNVVSATAYTFVLADRRRTTASSSTSATTMTIPVSTTTAFPIGSVIRVIQNAAGSVTIAAASGVTLNKISSKSLTITGQYGKVDLTQIAQDVWVLNGDT